MSTVESIAVIGSGITGLAAARQLQRSGRRVSLFERGGHFGGHANTVDVTLDGITHGVDTGFLVYNQRTYPLLVQLFAELGVTPTLAEMSFSVHTKLARGAPLEWSGSSLASVFAQRRNVLRPAFWRMLADVLRFNRLATAMATQGDDERLAQPVAEFLDEHRFSVAFREWYLLPMIACIWSCSSAQMLAFPMATLIRFCHNHGLLQVQDRPQWLSVQGGSREYVKRIVAELSDARLNTPVLSVQRNAAGVWLRTAQGSERFDKLVLACHSDEALRLLGAGATRAEAELLGAIRYQPNRAVLHTDTALLPARRAAWAAWNCEAMAATAAVPTSPSAGVCLHYWINRLQVLPWQQPVIVTLNALRKPSS